MKIDMVMPQMGESIVEGTIVKWLKALGETVEKDEIILEISTDKVDSEIPAPAAGTLDEILVKENETVAVGTVIARISTEAEPAVKEDKALQLAAGKPDEQQKPGDDSTENEQKTFLSPVVRKIAREYNLPMEQVKTIEGTGAQGRITKNDILNYVNILQGQKRPEPVVEEKEAPVVPAETKISEQDERIEVIPIDHVRKKIAEHMVMSKKIAPHVTSVAEVDMTRIVNYREQRKRLFQEQELVKLTYTAFFVECAVKALKEYPVMNSSFDGTNILQKKFINIGVAVGLDKGLIVPVIKNADQLNLAGIQRSLTDLADRARVKQLKPDEVQGGTFSITNIGTFGNIFGTPIINQPQVAILGTGAIKKRPVVIENDAIAIRSMMYLSLTYDHRIIDGLYAGKFLQRIVELLENYNN